MFREEYIKANEQIKPDNAFLERLKEAVTEENQVVPIGDYVDYANSEAFETLQAPHMEDRSEKRITWKNVVAIAACFALVITAVLVGGNIDWLKDGQGWQAGMESVVSDMGKDSQETTENAGLSAECQKQYEKVCKLFATCNVVIYEVEKFDEADSGMEYLQEWKHSDCALSPTKRDELIGNITAEKYILCNDCEAFSDAEYYVAVFEDDSCVYFAIDADTYIYIKAVSGMQSLADNGI